MSSDNLSAKASEYWNRYILALEHYSFGVIDQCEEDLRELLAETDLPLYLQAFCHIYFSDKDEPSCFFHAVEAAKVCSNMRNIAPYDKGIRVFLHRAHKNLAQVLEEMPVPTNYESTPIRSNATSSTWSRDSQNSTTSSLEIQSDALVAFAHISQQILEYQESDARQLDTEASRELDSYLFAHHVNRQAQEVSFSMEIELARMEGRVAESPSDPQNPIFGVMDVIRHILLQTSTPTSWERSSTLLPLFKDELLVDCYNEVAIMNRLNGTETRRKLVGMMQIFWEISDLMYHCEAVGGHHPLNPHGSNPSSASMPHHYRHTRHTRHTLQ